MSRRVLFAIWVLFTVIFILSGTVHAKRLAISAGIANIRSGPGTQYDVLWQVEKYYPLSVIEKSGKWYHFKDFEGDEGWVHQSLVKKIPSVITQKNKCNVRSGPGSKFKIIFTVEKGIPFKIIKRKGAWIHVEHADGDRGWIYKTLVW